MRILDGGKSFDRARDQDASDTDKRRTTDLKKMGGFTSGRPPAGRHQHARERANDPIGGLPCLQG